MKKRITSFGQDAEGRYLELNDGAGRIRVDVRDGGIRLDEGSGEGCFNGVTINAGAFEGWIVEAVAAEGVEVFEAPGSGGRVRLVLCFGGGNRHVVGIGATPTVEGWVNSLSASASVSEGAGAPATSAGAVESASASEPAPLNASADPIAPVPEPPRKKGRVLIVDDEALVRRVAVSAIEAAGYETAQAENGKEAMKVFSAKDTAPFSAVLLDVVMPDLDGMEVLSQIRKVQPDLPVVLMSGVLTLKGESFASRDTGTTKTAILSKPFTYASLLGSLESVLGKETEKSGG